ncbi:MAG TPA: hypothetical protein PK916_08755 [Bacteroidota bacterium]|nr:hypothetical protein [Bacteroidota bacterium]
MYHNWLIAVGFIILLVGCEHHTLHMEGYRIADGCYIWRVVNYDSTILDYDDTTRVVLDYEKMSRTRKELAYLELAIALQSEIEVCSSCLDIPSWLEYHDSDGPSFGELSADTNYTAIATGGSCSLCGTLWDGSKLVPKSGSKAERTADSLVVHRFQLLTALRSKLKIRVDPAQLELEHRLRQSLLRIPNPEEGNEPLGVMIEYLNP